MTLSKHDSAKRLLAKQRQMTSLMEQEFLSGGQEFVFQKTDWVPLYFDQGYGVLSDCGQITAYRAVTLRQELLWLVFHPNKSRGYHALASDPVQAIADAQTVWNRRAMVQRNWTEVERVARDLLVGRQSFDITMADAEASPLCTLGIQGFLRGIGFPDIKRISGRLAAMLMKVEPQMGFVIFEAMQRQGITATDQAGLAPAQEL